LRLTCRQDGTHYHQTIRKAVKTAFPALRQISAVTAAFAALLEIIIGPLENGKARQAKLNFKFEEIFKVWVYPQRFAV